MKKYTKISKELNIIINSIRKIEKINNGVVYKADSKKRIINEVMKLLGFTFKMKLLGKLNAIEFLSCRNGA